ncbi:MAG: class IV adenylate cyclase [Bryobacteraceae bacterium]
MKLRLTGADHGSTLLANAGFTVKTPRALEVNVYHDSDDKVLRRKQAVLRLRETGGRSILTFKGRLQADAGGESEKYKSREEIEVSISDFGNCQLILERIGYRPVFRYEKYRTEFQRSAEAGIATLDETPIGVFLELEGAPEWIDRTACELGFGEMDYIRSSYGELYREHRRRHPECPVNMTFI